MPTAGMLLATDLATAIGQIITPAAIVVAAATTNRLVAQAIIEGRTSIS